MIGPWRWAVIRSGLATREKTVALCLAVRMDEDGTIPDVYRPSVAQLALDCGLTPRTVSGSVARLEAAGFLKVTRGSGVTRSRYVAVQPRSSAAPRDESTVVKQHPSAPSGESHDTSGVLSNSTTEVLSNDTQPAQEPAQDPARGGTSTWSAGADSMHPLAIIDRFVEDGMHTGYVLQHARTLLRDDLGISVEDEHYNQVIDTEGGLDQLQTYPEHLFDVLLLELLIGQEDLYHPVDEIDNFTRVKLTTVEEVLARARALDERIQSDGWDLGVQAEPTSLRDLYDLYPYWFLRFLLDDVADSIPEVAA